MHGETVKFTRDINFHIIKYNWVC